MRGLFFSYQKERKRCFLKVLLDSTEEFFQSFEAGPFMGAAPSALNPGQGDDQGRYCCPLLLPKHQLCVTQGIGQCGQATK